MYSYTTHILDGHKYNTNDKKLQNASAIIQQERADFHNGMPSRGSNDCYFGHKENRMKIAKMLSIGSISPRLAKQIVTGNPYIRVDIYTTHIEVTGK